MNRDHVVPLKLLTGTATPPRRGSADAAGYDLFASEAFTIPAARVTDGGAVEVGRGLVPTGVAMAIPFGLYGRIAPRSGLAVKRGIDVGAGVIDPDYRDEIQILLFNFSPEPFDIAPGDRIAQILFERVEAPRLDVVESLDTTARAGGFGSTGTR